MPIDLQRPGALDAAPKETLGTSLKRRGVTLATFLIVIWAIWLLDWIAGGKIHQLGVVPRTPSGLLGIFTMPFLHGGFSHVLSNSIAIVLLGGVLILRSEAAFWSVSILGALASGLGTWIIGRGGAVHVGASGVIFAYFGFLLAAGIFERRIGSLLLSLLVFFFWGGMIWGVLPSSSAPTISWEGHLCGFLGGVLTAKLFAQKKKPAPSLP
jgi:membrane associated rhomboid family serine protease